MGIAILLIGLQFLGKRVKLEVTGPIDVLIRRGGLLGQVIDCGAVPIWREAEEV